MFSEEEKQVAFGLFDPISWADRTLGWQPRVSKDGIEYQAMMLRCTALRKVFRLGRRCGKTASICIRALHSINTRKHLKILAVTPFKSQIELIFDNIRNSVSLSHDLQDSIKVDRSNPYYFMEFWNGSYIRGFTSGTKSGNEAGSIRGQPADVVLLDEIDYLSDGDINSIISILNDHANVELWASSTPTGRRGKFYEWCHSPRFKEFYFPSQVLPHWNAEMEQDARDNHTQSAYDHEILAIFGEEEEGVFQKQYIDAAKADYSYEECVPKAGEIYGIGVDWNSETFGTEIMVVGWDGLKLRPRASYNIARMGWTQTLAVRKIIELNRIWQPLFINVDSGYGAMQCEVLKQYGYDQVGQNLVDARLKDIVESINFSSNLEVPDPITKQPIKKPMKPFLVENAVRAFEQNTIEIPQDDIDLLNQLENYIIKRRTQSGMPVYVAREARYGDHKLDAMMLALLGFTQRLDQLLQINLVSTVCFAKKIGEGRKRQEHINALEPAIVVADSREEANRQSRATERRPQDRMEPSAQAMSPYSTSGNPWGGSRQLWRWPGFMRDEPAPKRKAKYNSRPGRRNI